MTESLSRQIQSALSYRHLIEPNPPNFLYWYKRCPYYFHTITCESLGNILSNLFLSRNSLLAASLRELWELYVKITDLKNKQAIKIFPGPGVMTSDMYIVILQIEVLSPEKLRIKSLICEKWRWWWGYMSHTSLLIVIPIPAHSFSAWVPSFKRLILKLRQKYLCLWPLPNHSI